MEGAAIPPTSMNDFEQGTSKKESELVPKSDLFAKPKESKRGRLINWDLLKMTKEMLPPEAQRLCVMSYHRIIKNEGLY
jgi:hypothetical protein